MSRTDDTGTFLAPALLTGTSGEFLGRKAPSRLLRSRQVLFVLGQKGVGKSTVARRLVGEARMEVDTRQLEHALIDRVRVGKWGDTLAAAPALVVDGPVWLRNRRGAVALLLELAKERAQLGRRTVFCQTGQPDGSIEELINASEPGQAVVIGLRFPTGRRSRLRCARQLCEELGLPLSASTASDTLDPWGYDRLVAFLVERAWQGGRGE